MCSGVHGRLGVVAARKGRVLIRAGWLFVCEYGGTESWWQYMTIIHVLMCMKGLETVDLVN